MQEQPLVSVAMIFLNEEQFIAEAIISVLKQTYSHWELLLADDGSRDASTTIARQYARHYPEQIRYLEHVGHANRGTNASRNLASAHADGKYIVFLDADDILLPEALAEQVATIEAHPQVGMSYGPALWWYSWTGKAEDLARDALQTLGVATDQVIPPPQLLIRLLRREAAMPCPGSVIIRREVFEDVGRFDEVFRGLYDDQSFYVKICLHSSVFVSSACHVQYRQHADSLCAVDSRTGQQSIDRQIFASWLKEYLTAQGVRDAQIWRAVRAKLAPYRMPLFSRLRARVRQIMRDAEHLRAGG